VTDAHAGAEGVPPPSATPPPTAAASPRATRLPWAAWLGTLVALAAVWGLAIYAVPWVDAYLADILVRIGITLLAVLGLVLVLGFTGQFSLGHAGFMAVGAYASAWLCTRTGLPPALCVLGGGLVAGASGLAVGLPSLRLTGDYLAVVTLGFNGIILVLIQNSPALGGAQGMTSLPTLETYDTPGRAFGWVASYLLLGGLLLRNLRHSRHGRAFEAVRDNEVAVRSLGIDTTRVKVTAFVVGAIYAGIAGALLAHYRASIFPSMFELTRSVELLAMVVLGGAGSLSGPMLAGTVLTALPEVLRPVADIRMVLYAVILVVMMIVRPSGLLGSRELSDLFRRTPPTP
jgi:branched-chain amino acid transport system permease protein